MDVKDLRTEAALSERINDGSKYSQAVVALQSNRNKSYQDIGSNPLAKAEGAPVRPCAVIGPDRVVPPPASNDAFLKKSSVEPWPSPDNAYRRPPDYPHRLSNPNPIRNISPRQTFQENMQRINVPPTYNAVRHSDSANFNHIQDRNVPISKNVKPNMAPEAKYCDVPYAVNNLASEPKTNREPEMYMQSVNPSLTRTVPHVWPPGSVNVAASRTYSASDQYQYPQYSNCASQRPAIIPVPRPHRTIQDDPAYLYPDHYYPDANARFKPFPHVKERYPQTRYEYLSNYPGQFHPPPPIQPPKYDITKSGQSNPYPVYPHLKYLENRVPDPNMESYQRQANHQAHFNIPFRNQVIHPPYGQMPGSTPQKVLPYATDASIKAVASSKLHYDSNTKMYIDYENARNKPYPVADNYFVNEMHRFHQVKNPMPMPNYSSIGMRAMPSQQYYVKDSPQMRPFEYMPHFRNFEPHMSSVLRHAPQFSPNTLAISPTDSSTSNDTLQTHGTSQEDCGYVSQSSTASVRSLDSGIYKLPHEYYKKAEYKYGPAVGRLPTAPKPDANSKDKQKQMNVRQFLSMWNEGEEENSESNNPKEIIIQTGSSEAGNFANHPSNQDQLYVLGLVNVPSEELSKYEHIEKISKLPENIKGYNNLELYSRFEEAMESCNTTTPKVTSKEYPIVTTKNHPTKMFIEPLPRPVSPLDVEAKISQSVIHKEVGCNFEIRPCTPKMLNVEVAAPAQNILGERVIEKVTNPHLKVVKSPLPSKSDESLNCHTIKKQENTFAMTDNPSCKMTCSPYSSNNLESIKANYTLQDLEINSGVCLASLPRLDNEIELNFPEVNQQFINANKGDRVSPGNQQTTRETTYKSNIPESGLTDSRNEQTETEKCNLITESDKTLNKLSKYRKSKANAEHSAYKEENVRTDSVIIKNPENIKNIEDRLLENSFNPLNLCSPINLTSQSSQWHNSPSESDGNKDAEVALDFSLNKPSKDLPIIEEAKDMIAKPFQTNNLLSETDLQIERVSSLKTISFSNDNVQENNEVVVCCNKIDQNNKEYSLLKNTGSGENDEVRDVIRTNTPISNINNSVLNDPNNKCEPNDKDQHLVSYDTNKDLINLRERPESNIPEQTKTINTMVDTLKNNLMTSDEKAWLDRDINNGAPETHIETDCDKYSENVKKVFSPDQYHIIDQIENDFEHDEISANLEKMFRESDEELPNDAPMTVSNSGNISSNLPVTESSEASLTNIKSLSNTSCRINKELFSPWIQKLLTYNEGLCFHGKMNKLSIFSDYTPEDKTLCIKSMTTDDDRLMVNISAPIHVQTDVLIEEIVSTKSEFDLKICSSENTLESNIPQLNNSFDKKVDNSIEPSKILTEHCDTKKTKKIRKSLTEIRKKEIKKRKKKLHKYKLIKTSFNNNTNCEPEKCSEPQIEVTHCENKQELSLDAISVKEIPLNCNKSTKTSDTVTDSSDIFKNPLSIENDANEIALTENYSKILTYCNTPEDDEIISERLSDCAEYPDIKQSETCVNEETDAADLCHKTIECINMNIDDDHISNKLRNSPNERTSCEAPNSTMNTQNETVEDFARISSNESLSHTDAPSFSGAYHTAKIRETQVEGKISVNEETETNNSSDEESKERLNDNFEETNEVESSSTDDSSIILHSETVSEHLLNSSIDTNNFNTSCDTGSLLDHEIVKTKCNKSIDKATEDLKEIYQDNTYQNDKANESFIDNVVNKEVNMSPEDNSTQNNNETELFSCDNSKNQNTLNNDFNKSLGENVNDSDIEKHVTISDNEVSEIVQKDNVIKNMANSNNTEKTENKNQLIEISGKFVEDSAESLEEKTVNSLEVSQNETKIKIISKNDSKVNVVSTDSKHDLNLYQIDAKTIESNKTNGMNVEKDIPIVMNEKTDIATPKVLSSYEIDIINNEHTDTAKDNLNMSIDKCTVINVSNKVSDKSNNEEVSTSMLVKEIDDGFFVNSPSKFQICKDNNSQYIVENHSESEKAKSTTEVEKETEFEEKSVDELRIVRSSNLRDDKCDQNNTILKDEEVGTLPSCDVPDKWIQDQPLSPNGHVFSTTDENFILYDNSEENLCYPVVENSLADIESETCIIPDTCIQESPIKSRLALKRSFSDSALNSIKTRDTSDRQLLDNTPMWPPKRQKVYEFNHSEQQLINENICNFIQNNRRNSVSSYYNAENVSFCILIDNDCILTDDNEEEKICFAEVTEDCVTETDTEHNVGEIVCCSEESELNISDSVMMDYNDKSIQESWLDDVACVETVVSDDIVEETSNDAPLSPKYTKSSDCDESEMYLSEPTNECNISDENTIHEIENVPGSPCEDDGVFYDRERSASPYPDDNNIVCKVYTDNEDCSRSPTSDYTNSVSISNTTRSELPEDKENICDNNISTHNFANDSYHNDSGDNIEINFSTQEHENNFQNNEEVHFPESSMDNVFFNYDKKDEEDDTSYSPTSSSPEVSSTTSEEKSSSILLKITNYNGSRVSEVNEVNRNMPRCKFTESKDYSNSQENFPKRPLMTKAARKYIPPLKETIRDLKVKLPLPQPRLLKLKQLKLSKNEPKVVKQNIIAVPKKPKPNFEDVLKSIDEVQIKMHKEKNKKIKNIVPKVVIKKNENGSHYTSSSSKRSVDPDLTGRKWQPWVFLEKNRFIDNMAIKNKTKAIYSHRKNTYVLAEKFQKYKSASDCSAKFIISQPNSGDSSKGQLKYTIRLKHLY